MKKNLSYRDKLLELAKIYRITEIQNYIKRKKHLTNSQIEHVLKKNNVPIPKEINISSYNRLFLKPVSNSVTTIQEICSGHATVTCDERRCISRCCFKHVSPKQKHLHVN